MPGCGSAMGGELGVAQAAGQQPQHLKLAEGRLGRVTVPGWAAGVAAVAARRAAGWRVPRRLPAALVRQPRLGSRSWVRARLRERTRQVPESNCQEERAWCQDRDVCQPIGGYRQVKHPRRRHIGSPSGGRGNARRRLPSRFAGRHADLISQSRDGVEHRATGHLWATGAGFPGVAAVTGGQPATQVIPHVGTS